MISCALWPFIPLPPFPSASAATTSITTAGADGAGASAAAGSGGGASAAGALLKWWCYLSTHGVIYTVIESAVLTLFGVTHTIWGQYNTACVKLEPASTGLTLVSGAI